MKKNLKYEENKKYLKAIIIFGQENTKSLQHIFFLIFLVYLKLERLILKNLLYNNENEFSGI